MNYEEKIRETLEQKIAQLKIVDEQLAKIASGKLLSAKDYEKNEIEIKAQISILRFLLSEN
jgi:hypothetical protein